MARKFSRWFVSLLRAVVYPLNKLNHFISQKLHFTLNWIAGIEFIGLLAAGFTMIQVDEYAFADFLWILGLGVLLARLSSANIRDDHKGRDWTLFTVKLMAVIFGGIVLLIWSNIKRGDKPWSAFVPWSRSYLIESRDAPKPPFSLLPPHAPEISKYFPAKPSEGKGTSRQVIEIESSSGNLFSRANALADEIVNDLAEHGMGDPSYRGVVVQKMPFDDQKALNEWIDNRWGYFRWAFLRHVIDIREEFSQFHIKDSQLDDVLREEQEWEASSRNYHLPPEDMRLVADRLRLIANQLPKH